MKPFLDWSAYEDAGMGDAYADIPKHGGDFAKAVAACINSQQCEAAGKQVMCPSFRVSGNPNLSTGGRVKLLKAALNADLVDQALADPTLAAAMALCVACKGCKRECESNVDMALIKSEYLAQQRTRKGVPLRGKLFAWMPHWQHRYPGLSGWIAKRNRSSLLARVAERVLGLAADTPLPVPSARPFADEVQDSADVTCEAPRPEVVLLVDTFARHFEPDIAAAAMMVLKAGGYRVRTATPEPSQPEPARPLCCGRTFLAQGMIAEARAEAERLFTALRPHAEAGRLIVGLEASCVLGLRDDAQALGLDPDLAAIGKQVLLFEEFLAKEIMAKRLNLPLRTADAATLVHGHCHQKAVGAMKSVRKVLKLIPEHDFEMIDAGCCGMAGTFGLEREHARLSQDMAEQALLPALRAAPQATVVANGFSCRQQIRNLGGRRPQHLAQLLRDALA